MEKDAKSDLRTNGVILSCHYTYLFSVLSCHIKPAANSCYSTRVFNQTASTRLASTFCNTVSRRLRAQSSKALLLVPVCC